MGRISSKSSNEVLFDTDCDRQLLNFCEEFGTYKENSAQSCSADVPVKMSTSHVALWKNSVRTRRPHSSL